MAYDPGALDKTLAAAVGDDPSLIAELRSAFIQSAQRQVSALHNAVNDQEWQVAAWRLKGLAASFGVMDLMTLANQAAEGVPFDNTLLERIDKSLASFSSSLDFNSDNSMQ
ncbi:Hpt domain-containing protein [Parasphingopyxis algicola]|uniref:Hpt domain-containing protein n=1 Tax=Parasphingopyxis algicola TaxID=2026624 RepID=UPI0015A2DE3E|nr:Hpt domain-containing protein [Parasphingopyxis algicola]QLC24368.1 Hpt domain-containing protein [Parasphingopyxis algicola]